MSEGRCPVCRHAATDSEHAPFCSLRCRDIDMGQWLSGSYRVPTDEQTPAPPATESGNGQSPQ